MRIVVVYTPDIGFMNDFIFQIVSGYKNSIAGVIATKGSILKRKNRLEQAKYLVALVIILGPVETFRLFKKTIAGKLFPQNKIEFFCKQNSIPFMVVTSINSEECRQKLEELKPDLVFNQSQHIVKKNILDIPKIGTLNRHGSILPAYKGRLAPFWQLMNKEKNGGLTFHLLDEKIDSGPIVLQQTIPIEPGETVVSLTRKMFAAAVEKFGDVIEILEKEDYKSKLKFNDASKSTYFTSPGIKDALKYRFAR